MQAVTKATESYTYVELMMLGSTHSDKKTPVLNQDRRALSSAFQSYDIAVTFNNNIGLAEGTSITLDLSNTADAECLVTVFAPPSGEHEVSNFCCDIPGDGGMGETIDDEDALLLVVSILSVMWSTCIIY